MNNPVPHHIITEAIGQFRFSRVEEEDIQIAEQLASTEYPDMETFLSAAQAEVQGGKNMGLFLKESRQMPNNPYFKEYFKSNGYVS